MKHFKLFEQFIFDLNEAKKSVAELERELEKLENEWNDYEDEWDENRDEDDDGLNDDEFNAKQDEYEAKKKELESKIEQLKSGKKDSGSSAGGEKPESKKKIKELLKEVKAVQSKVADIHPHTMPLSAATALEDMDERLGGGPNTRFGEQYIESCKEKIKKYEEELKGVKDDMLDAKEDGDKEEMDVVKLKALLTKSRLEFCKALLKLDYKAVMQIMQQGGKIYQQLQKVTGEIHQD